MSPFEQFSTSTYPPVRGYLHRAESPSGDALVLTHGAGGNAHMPLLLASAEAFSSAGFVVLRCDLPFRQQRSFGPPRPADAARDRLGLKNAIAELRNALAGKGHCFFLGGQSYGGGPASMLFRGGAPGQHAACRGVARRRPIVAVVSAAPTGQARAAAHPASARYRSAGHVYP